MRSITNAGGGIGVEIDTGSKLPPYAIENPEPLPPGPYRVEIEKDLDGNPYKRVVIAANGVRVTSNRFSRGPAIPNAVSALPELIAALQRLLKQPRMSPVKMRPEEREELWAAHADAHDAIEKATGAA